MAMIVTIIRDSLSAVPGAIPRVANTHRDFHLILTKLLRKSQRKSWGLSGRTRRPVEVIDDSREATPRFEVRGGSERDRRSVVRRTGAKRMSLFHRFGIALVILGMMQSLAPPYFRPARSSLRHLGRLRIPPPSLGVAE